MNQPSFLIFAAQQKVFMQQSLQVVSQLLAMQNDYKIISVEPMPQSASDRQYFRIITANGSLIGTFNLNAQENETFIYFSRHFAAKGLPVPTIIASNSDCTAYIQTDLG